VNLVLCASVQEQFLWRLTKFDIPYFVLPSFPFDFSFDSFLYRISSDYLYGEGLHCNGPTLACGNRLRSHSSPLLLLMPLHPPSLFQIFLAISLWPFMHWFSRHILLSFQMVGGFPFFFLLLISNLVSFSPNLYGLSPLNDTEAALWLYMVYLDQCNAVLEKTCILLVAEGCSVVSMQSVGEHSQSCLIFCLIILEATEIKISKSLAIIAHSLFLFALVLQFLFRGFQRYVIRYIKFGMDMSCSHTILWSWWHDFLISGNILFCEIDFCTCVTHQLSLLRVNLLHHFPFDLIYFTFHV
jgi:hypothetical protein